MAEVSMEIAVHRLVVREAEVSDIDLLRRRAAAGEDVLGAVLTVARDDAAARAQIEQALAGAATVELPERAGGGAPAQVRLRRIGLTAPGWLAAAAVALAWAMTGGLGGPGGPVAPQPAPGLLPVGWQPTADEALDQYLETGFSEGRVLGELPALMVETRALDGRAEIVYVRRVLERTVVDEIVEEGVDDGGRIVERPVSPAAFARPEEL